MGRKIKTIKYGAFQISKNSENNSITRRSRDSHKLIDYMNCIGNIRASNSERTKHIEIDCHFIRHHLLQGTLTLQSISSQDQLADIFTKPLPPRTF